MVDLFEGYQPIAVRDDRLGNCVISYNFEKKLYVVMVNKKPVGPLTLVELKAMVENIHDVLDLRGQYVYIQEYDVYGNRK